MFGESSLPLSWAQAWPSLPRQLHKGEDGIRVFGCQAPLVPPCGTRELLFAEVWSGACFLRAE